MDEATISDRITAFVTERFFYGERAPTPDESLLDAGVLDSMTLVQLVAFIEDSLGIRLARRDLAIERFDTVAGMSRWLAEKRS